MKYLKIFLIFFSVIFKTFGQTKSGQIVLQKNASLSWTIQEFKESEHNVEICKSEFNWDYICKIDGKPWFGTDLGMTKPKNQLKKLILNLNNSQIELEVANMFNPNYSGSLSGHQFLLKKEGEFYKLYGFFSDGAGTYTVHWKIIKNSSVREVISNEESYFFWQNEN